MVKHRQHGFTLVELIVVIIVIAILATITTVLYMGVQKEARDVKNVDAMHKVADAIELFISKNQHFPRGGWGSTVALGSSTECANGSNGYVSSGTYYTCSIEDTLVASGYLPAGFIAGLSPNSLYTYTDGRASMMVYVISSTKAMIMNSMEAPSAQDTANFNAALTQCYGSVPGSGYAPRDSYGMKNGVCITYSTP